MKRYGFLILTAMFLLVLPLAAVALDMPAQVYQNGSQNVPIAVPGVAFSVFGGSGGKTLLSSGVSGSDGTCKLGNVPAGTQVVVKLTKDGYETQYDVRSYSEADAEAGVVLWIGPQANINSLYKNLGLTFDATKGQVYLEVVDELTGDGIDEIQLGTSSGQAFDLGQGDYLIANAAGSSVQVTFAKPGYAFDVESATIPLYAGAMTQYYVKEQSGGAISDAAVAPITGYILRLSDAVAISGVTVTFTAKGFIIPSVHTDKTGFYTQKVPLKKIVKIVPETRFGFTFKPASKSVYITGKNPAQDFKGCHGTPCK